MAPMFKCLLVAVSFLFFGAQVQGQELTHLGVPVDRIIAITGNQSFYGGGVPQWGVWKGGVLPPVFSSTYSVPAGYSLVILEVATAHGPLALKSIATLYLSPPGLPGSGIVHLLRIPLEANTDYVDKTQLLSAGIRIPGGYGMYWGTYVPQNGGNLNMQWTIRGYLVKE